MIQFAVSKGCLDQLSAKSRPPGGRGRTVLFALVLVALGLGDFRRALAHPGHSHDDQNANHQTEELAEREHATTEFASANAQTAWFRLLLRVAGGISVLASFTAVRLGQQPASERSAAQDSVSSERRVMALGLLASSFVLGGATLVVAWLGLAFDPGAAAPIRLATATATLCGSWAALGTLSLLAQQSLLDTHRHTNSPPSVAWALVALALVATVGLVLRWTFDEQGRVARSCFVAIIAVAACGSSGIWLGRSRRAARLTRFAALSWGLIAVAQVALSYSGHSQVSWIESGIIGGMMLLSSLLLWRCLRLGARSLRVTPPQPNALTEDHP